MANYVFVDKRDDGPTAYAKVAVDIVRILEPLGFKKIPLNRWEPFMRGTTRLLGQLWWFNAVKILHRINKDDIVLLQYPDVAIRQERFGLPLLKWIKNKGAKLVVLIHDIDMPRFNGDKEIRQGDEFVLRVVRYADKIVVHNYKMTEWFTRRNIPSDKLIELGVFDYLANPQLHLAKFSHCVTLAGNLSPQKAAYATHLKGIEGVEWNVYSGCFNEAEMGGKNVHYCGTCQAEEFPSKLTQGFGLVWDGDNVDGCSGNAGRYTLVVSPHKLSLYLTSGLPVIVCADAAIAKFVKSNGVGITVRSLRELPERLKDISEAEYNEMATNALKIGRRMREGAYTREAIEKTLDLLAKSAV